MGAALLRDVQVNRVVDPVRGHDTQGEEELEHATEHAADAFRGHLGRVHGNDDSGHADPDAADDSGNVEDRERVRVDDLKDSAEIEDGRGEDKGPAAAELGREGPDEETGEEGCVAECQYAPYRTKDARRQCKFSG